jgi:hypothetical protein
LVLPAGEHAADVKHQRVLGLPLQQVFMVGPGFSELALLQSRSLVDP